MREAVTRIKALWGRWPAPARIAAVLVAGALLVSALVARLGPGPRAYEVLLIHGPEANGPELARLFELLDREGIAWRSKPVEGGVAVEVRGGDDYRRAAVLAERHGFRLAGGTSFDWLYNGGVLAETRERFRARLDESRLRELERSIAWNPRISSANIVVHRRREGVFLREDKEAGSASVALRLRPTVERLTVREAEAVREMVSGALALAAENVRIVDDRGHVYRPQGPQGAALEREREAAEAIREVVEALYLPRYRPSEFRVGVLLDLDEKSSSVESVEYDRDRSFSAPRRAVFERGTAPAANAGDSEGQGIREISEEVPVFSNTRTRTEIPSGAIRDVRINLVFDLAAVRRILERRAEVLGGPREAAAASLEEEVRAYAREQEKFVASQLPFSGAKVTAAVEPFTSPGAPPELPAAALVHAPEPGGAPPLLIAAFVAVAALLVAGLLAALRKRPQASDAAPETAVPGACAETLSRAARASERVRREPETAAAIVRHWLAGAGAAGDSSGTSSEEEPSGREGEEPSREEVQTTKCTS